MSTAACIVALLSAMWIDYGWQPLAGGGHEYLIQVPPELIDTLRTEGIESYVPSDVRDIRRIRIMVGNERLPQTGAPPPTVDDQAADDQAATVGAKSAAIDNSRGTLGNDTPEPTAGEPRVAKYAGEANAGVRGGSDPTGDSRAGADGGVAFLGLDALTLAQIGLGVAGALVVFLAWAHLSMRARYRALLRQSHAR